MSDEYLRQVQAELKQFRNANTKNLKRIAELESQLNQKWDSPECIVETINFLVNRLWIMGLPKESEGL